MATVTPVLALAVPLGIPLIGGKSISAKLTSFDPPGLLGGLVATELGKMGGTATGSLWLTQNEDGTYSLNESADIDIKIPELPEDVFKYSNAQVLAGWEGKVFAKFVPLNTEFQLVGTAAFEVA